MGGPDVSMSDPSGTEKTSRTVHLQRVAAALFLLLGILVMPAGAQKKIFKDLPVNHPKQCPYCGGDPKKMEAVGIVSHGGFEFAKGTTDSLDQEFEGFDIFWIETAHSKLGLELKPYKITAREKGKVEAELNELRKALPAIPQKVRVLDPWLRTHLYAARMQALYKDVVRLLHAEDAAFPETSVATFDPAKGYWGMGPHLGMKQKYETLVIRNESNCATWLRKTYGLLTRAAQRWHMVDRGALILITHLEQGKLQIDEALHGHLVFNQVQNMLNGYKYYSYDKPLWILEGLAHWFGREVTAKYNNFDGGEGSAATITRKENWEPPTRKLVQKGDYPGIGALMRIKGHGEFGLPEHFTTWSMIDYLQRVHPGFVGELLSEISGLLDDKYMPQGGRVNEVTRKFFKEKLGQTTVAFEQSWRAWVLETYSSK